MKYKYYAFISYSHKDTDWAKWLQHEFEYYKLPTTLMVIKIYQNILDPFLEMKMSLQVVN